MKTLNVNITNKVAVYSQRGGDIVCNNSDYQIKFSFDSEWDSYSSKTARFSWNGQYQDVTFTGDTAKVPPLYQTSVLRVGVYAGDLSTTTSARIRCIPSVLCDTTTPAPESGKTYYNEAKAAAERAEAAAKTAAAEAVVALQASCKDGLVQKNTTRNLLNIIWHNANIVSSGYVPMTDPAYAASPDYIPVTGGETYTLSWIKNDKSVYMYIFEYKADQSFIKSTNMGATWKTPPAHIQVDAECAYIRMKLWTDKTTFSSFEELFPEHLQLELGKETTEYIPPLIISPSEIDYSPAKDIFTSHIVQEAGTSAEKVMSQKAITEYLPKVATRNLMTLTFVNGRMDKNGVFEELSTGLTYAATPEYLPITGGITYTVSYKDVGKRALYIQEYTADKTHIKYTQLTLAIAAGTKYATITLEANCSFIRMNCYEEGAPWTGLIPEELQIELGAYCTSYVKPQVLDPSEIDANAVSEEISNSGRFVASTKLASVKNPLLKQSAHRGYLGTGAPQCTAPAYIEAKKFGFDVGENDLWVTADGVFVMAHDTTLPSDRSLVIAESTYETLYAGNMGTFNGKEVKIMTFEEWLILMKKIGLEPLVDLKSRLNAEQCLQAMAIVRKHGLLDKITWCTNAYETIEGIRAAYPMAKLALLGWTTATLSGMPHTIIEGRPDLTILYPQSIHVTAEVVETARTEGVGVECWHVGYESYGFDTEEKIFAEIDRVVELGITGICLDTYLPGDYFLKKLSAEWDLK